MNINVALIINGEFKTMLISVEMVAALSARLRNEGPCEIHTANGSYICEGIVVTARGSKKKFMIFD